jgi:uncharacterized protein (TIGR04255 family)
MIVLSETPSFRKPPVIEVSFGIQFSRIEQWQTRHFGEFWSRVKDKFKGSADAPPLEFQAGGPPTVQLLLLPPLRRVIFATEDQTSLLQVQDNRFHFNWRQLKTEDTYPRFGSLFPQFKEWFGVFSEFLQEKKLGEAKPIRFELTYINHIGVAEDFSKELERTVKLFNWSAVSPQYLAAPTTVTAAWQFDMPDKLGVMGANLTHVKTAESKELLVLALNCVGESVDLSQMDLWFESAHRSIVFGFTDLTTEAAHKLWEREQ